MSLRVAIIAAAFNESIVGPMIEAATAEVLARGGKVEHAVRVPGAYEIPLPAKLLLEHGNIDAVVALGYIEKGETLHGEVMGQVVHGMLLKLSIKNEKPVGLGIIGPGATPEQAETRKIAYARAAVGAVFAQRALLEALPPIAY